MKQIQLKIENFVLLIIFITISSCSAGLNTTPYLYVDSTEVNFGKTVLMTTLIKDIEIQNHDAESLIISNIEITEYSTEANGDEFSIVNILDAENNSISNIDKIEIKKFSFITLKLGFKPAITLEINAELKFMHNDRKIYTPYEIKLIGTGIASVILFNPDSLDFGEAIVNVVTLKSLKLTNISNDEIEINSIILNPSLPDFSIYRVIRSSNDILSSNDYPFSLDSNDYLFVDVNYVPSDLKYSSTKLYVEYLDSNEIYQTIANISGTGIANSAPVIEYIDTDPVKIGAEAIIRAKIIDNNGQSDIQYVTAELSVNNKIYSVMNDLGINGDEASFDNIYSCKITIPFYADLYGYHEVSVTAIDKSNAYATGIEFQLIYTGNLIEVGSGKQYTTIKPAVNAAINGDCVLIHDGTYNSSGDTIEENRDIDLNGKQIIITSKNGADNAIISVDGAGGNFHRAFICLNGETVDTIIEGLTIKSGFMRHEYGGGAIVCYESDLTMLNCYFFENIGTCDSSGIAYGGVISILSNSNVILWNCTFRNNNALV